MPYVATNHVVKHESSRYSVRGVFGSMRTKFLQNETEMFVFQTYQPTNLPIINTNVIHAYIYNYLISLILMFMF